MNRRTLDRGELTRIIIGTVVAHEQPINARRLTEILNAQHIAVTARQMNVRLGELAKAGRIERVEKGLYEGC